MSRWPTITAGLNEPELTLLSSIEFPVLDIEADERERAAMAEFDFYSSFRLAPFMLRRRALQPVSRPNST